MENICKRNCQDCNLQPTLETKQICASFNAMQILAFVENKLMELDKAVNRPIILPEQQTNTSISITDFNGNVVSGYQIEPETSSELSTIAPVETETV